MQPTSNMFFAIIIVFALYFTLPKTWPLMTFAGGPCSGHYAGLYGWRNCPQRRGKSWVLHILVHWSYRLLVYWSLDLLLIMVGKNCYSLNRHLLIKRLVPKLYKWRFLEKLGNWVSPTKGICFFIGVISILWLIVPSRWLSGPTACKSFRFWNCMQRLLW